MNVERTGWLFGHLGSTQFEGLIAWMNAGVFWMYVDVDG